MEAKQNSLIKFLQQQDAQFYIPVYQRNYDWREEHCKQLLADIIKAGSDDEIDSHFIGSIVYIQLNTIIGSPELTIIDGQQRLTTLTILIAALVRRAREYDKEEQAKKLTNRFLINEDMDDNEKLKLKPIKKDDSALKFAIGLQDSEIPEYSRIIENYNFFYNSINSENFEIINKGFQKLIFIEIALEKSKDDPQKIFQSLNSTGLDLSQADLIRNYILMGLDYKFQLKIYEKYWIQIENNTTEHISKTIRMSDFIRDFLTFKFSSIPNQNKVFEVFKDKFIFNEENDLILVIEDLKTYSKIYNKFINPEVELSPKIQDNLKLIKKLQINVSYPFLLQVFRAYENNIITENVLNEVLEIIQSFVWRRFVCGVATNALNKIFMDLYKDIDESDFINSLNKSLIRKRGSQRFPNDDEVMKELQVKDMYNIQPKNRTYFLERLENYGHKIQTLIDGNQEISIEHIFPQKPHDSWKKSLGEEYEQMKNLINTAPNLTLSAFNTELSNSPFLVKRDYPGKGYKDSPLRIDKFLGNIDVWNIEKLEKRRQWIFDRFQSIWRYPIAEIDEDDNFIEINFLDINPNAVTHHEIDYFIFFDTKYSNPNWSNLLSTVSKIMFEREPHKFLSTDLYKKLKVGTDVKKYIRPFQISNSYFIELSLSASDIVKRTQAILEQCETDDELVIKLKD